MELRMAILLVIGKSSTHWYQSNCFKTCYFCCNRKIIKLQIITSVLSRCLSLDFILTLLIKAACNLSDVIVALASLSFKQDIFKMNIYRDNHIVLEKVV